MTKDLWPDDMSELEIAATKWKPTTKRYLGDGVYVDVDERGIVLTTENGICATNTIVLEPEVMAALEQYLKALRTGR
jgi:hypothetical protein